MLIASWNINSLRHRQRQLRTFVRKYQPDVLCLQETKVHDDAFPTALFDAIGYPHLVFRGMKAYHGVAIASRLPVTRSWSYDIHRLKEPRHIAVTLESGVDVHNVYFPAGGDDPRPDRNPKFARKLAFIDSAARWMKRWEPNPSVLVGDLNVAPLETDVWSHKALKRSMTHTPLEIAALARLQRSRDWVDVAREFVPPEEKLFTWWSYRAPNHRTANKGRRLDHVWVTPDLRDQLAGFSVAEEVRAWKTPSDHAPLLCDLDVSR